VKLPPQLEVLRIVADAFSLSQTSNWGRRVLTTTRLNSHWLLLQHVPKWLFRSNAGT